MQAVMFTVLDWLSLWLYIISCVTINLFNQDPAELSPNCCCAKSGLFGKLMGHGGGSS